VKPVKKAKKGPIQLLPSETVKSI